MKNFANYSLKFFLIISILVFLYTIYRAEVHFYGQDRSIIYAKYFKYIVISVLFSFLFLIVLKFNQETKLNFVIVFYSFLIAVYLVEIILLSKFNYLPQDQKKEFSFSKINKKQIVKIKSLLNNKIYPYRNFGEVNLENGENVYELSYLSNSEIYLCNETGTDIFYKSDRYGFRNPEDNIWDKNHIDYLLIGDSFVHGACVENNAIMSELIKNLTNKNVLNLGIGGSGPLKQYATFIEYGLKMKPKKVFWFFFEGNDLTKNLRHEKENKILIDYLNDKDQEIIKKKFIIDSYMKKKIIEEIALIDKKIEISPTQDQTNKDKDIVENFLQKTRYLRLWAIRNLINNYFNRDEIDPLFYKILKKTNQKIKQWGGELYFVYLPEKKRYSNKFNYHISRDRFRNKDDVMDLVNSLNIKLIDTDEKVFRNVGDPLKLFDFHYNEIGYKKIVDTLINVD